MDEKFTKALHRELKLHSRALGIPDGAADSFINATIHSVEKNLKSKTVITTADLKRNIAKELKKYNADLAYIYQNRDTII